MKTDILIAGAGPAGLFAAITAAQSGAKVVIVESNT
ncbi:MAG: FAD-dependent oxidoreductase, partial [Planctomycetes bacterium]|nr:FAD-dependent oxidoreductase [Planctomycetota bacterium]